MSSLDLLSTDTLLAPWPSAVQAATAFTLLALVVYREVLHQLAPVPAVIGRVDRAVRVLLPVVAVVLAVRLLVILQ